MNPSLLLFFGWLVGWLAEEIESLFAYQGSMIKRLRVCWCRSMHWVEGHCLAKGGGDKEYFRVDA